MIKTKIKTTIMNISNVPGKILEEMELMFYPDSACVPSSRRYSLLKVFPEFFQDKLGGLQHY